MIIIICSKLRILFLKKISEKTVEFLAFSTKLPIMVIMASKDFTGSEV